MTRSLDTYWASKKEWCHFEGNRLVVNEDAPPEAQESWKRFLKQLKKKKEWI